MSSEVHHEDGATSAPLPPLAELGERATGGYDLENHELMESPPKLALALEEHEAATAKEVAKDETTKQRAAPPIDPLAMRGQRN